VSGNENSSRSTASRRALVGGFVGVGVGVPLLAACGSGSDSGSDAGGSGGSSSGDSGSGGSGGSGGSTTSTGSIGKTSDVPVGGGKIYASEKVVVTQPTEGDFKAFSAVCTHQGCLVAQIKDKDIDCTCHGSKFSIEDGSVVTGPANKPLEELHVTVNGEDITVA
jgi:nitrite reductase/ring-hydroxylating ferredoxin subunit